MLSVQLPIWLTDTLPLTDYPVHLSLIQAVDLSGNTPTILKDRFETHWFSPYAVTYLLAQSMTLFFPVETIGKILLSIYLLLTPLVFFRFMNSVGKPVFLAFPIYLLLFNFNVSWGFLPFLMAIPLMIESSTQSFIFLKKPSWKQGVILTFLFILLFFTHIFALILGLGFLLCAFIISLTTDKQFRSAALVPIVAIPAVILSVLWRFTRVLTENDFFFLDKGVRFAPLMLKIKYFPDYCISGDPSRTSRTIFACLIILILLGFLPSSTGADKNSRCKPSDATSQTTFRSHRLGNMYGVLCFAVIGLIYLLCPYSWLTAVWLFNRVAFLAPAYSLPLLPRSSRFHPAFFMIVPTVLCAWLSLHTSQCYKSFSDEAQKGRDIIRLIPAQKSMRYIPFNNRSVFADHEPYVHFDQYYQLDKHGTVHNPFALLTHIPIQYTREYKAIESGFRPEQFLQGYPISVDPRIESTDYILLRTHPLEPYKKIIQRLFPDTPASVVTVFYDGTWILLKKTGELH